ncbi:MAG: GlsB/YeaQ/YmgE family stress response membrane protein [Blautia sp.]|jgi:uncharacterized membrane protein YeaQ/YmgE (transglycosylase-associated protein family)|uniref:GlsB/YeaQ/YmgE family stress response membrane protein n=1 Tax=Blautia sp. TaxID=1955243 RepID=UPI003D93D5DA
MEWGIIGRKPKSKNSEKFAEPGIIKEIKMLTSLIIGIISGWIAGRIMGVKKGGFIKTIVIGIAGSFVGGGIMSLVGFYAYGFLANIMVSVLGACIFLYIGKKIFK